MEANLDSAIATLMSSDIAHAAYLALYLVSHLRHSPFGEKLAHCGCSPLRVS